MKNGFPLKETMAVALMAGLLLGCKKEEAETTASTSATVAAKPAEHEIVINDTGCTPGDFSVSAGKNTFKIVNKSQRAVEWEILKGVLVVEERENIAPGFTSKLTADLVAGDYEITCGLLSNPKGKLTVSGQSSGVSNEKQAAILKLEGPVKEYKAYAVAEVAALVSDVEKFAATIKAGKLKEAQALFAPSRIHYERIEPIAELFSDLDGSMDARVDDFKGKEQDPEFTGFHRIEYVLFHEKTTDGLAPFADKLVEDAKALQTRMNELAFPPNKVVGGAAALIEEVANGKISGEEDRYSGTDLSDFNANVEGSKKIVDILRPMLESADAALLKKVDENFKLIDSLLGKYKEGNGYAHYSKLTEQDRNALKAPITTLAEELSKLRGLLGIN
ncbi:iron uptake system protein EfeO [Leeia sp. TBRC 13508]|uniref:Iron uptake system protein EfeO n=1 Tax=Leeia speluncae TaxID=2884804 RepID=A0ABS8DAF5_9NEIS|nr:iron uptake system protein EfeO [Leeia speluncae]MCB6185191.1 iron uptake system protein EfeO [Leeia speluncae]